MNHIYMNYKENSSKAKRSNSMFNNFTTLRNRPNVSQDKNTATFDSTLLLKNSGQNDTGVDFTLGSQGRPSSLRNRSKRSKSIERKPIQVHPDRKASLHSGSSLGIEQDDSRANQYRTMQVHRPQYRDMHAANDISKLSSEAHRSLSTDRHYELRPEGKQHYS